MQAHWILYGIVGLLAAVVFYDLTQRKHAILKNFPIIGHFRYWLEAVGPELRQYIVTDNDEERPFTRDQRRWIYTSAKRANTYFGFGTDNDLDLSSNYIIIKHSAFPLNPSPHRKEYLYPLPCAKILGGPRGRKHAFRPASIVNVSGMSFGSLSGPAVEALNRGSAIANCLQNTGEGGISPYHQKGGELIWQIGTGYFGCRSKDGGFDLELFKAAVAANPVKAIEVKLSQGAKPGLGGLLPAAKISAEIAAIRGIPRGQDCASPCAHTVFRDVDSMLDFVEMLASETGLPIGIKSAVGDSNFWIDLATQMASGQRGVDFIAIDGGEGGTGAAPLAFSDHVSLPFRIGFARVYRIFAEMGLATDIVWIGSGRLGFPETSMLAMALGCDMINVGREGMISIGCIQAQRCHTDHCPTGVATQNKWLIRGLDPHDKSARLANYICSLRKEMMQLSHACGEPHPAFVTADRFDILDGAWRANGAADVFNYEPDWGKPALKDQEALRAILAAEGELN
jgi:glutamate synthase domain-containing protein 2